MLVIIHERGRFFERTNEKSAGRYMIMKKCFFPGLLLLFLLAVLSGCAPQEEPITQPSAADVTEKPTQQSTAATAEPTVTATQPTTAPATEPTTEPSAPPEHSELYIPGLSVEDVILYFHEVCLDAEMVNSGNPTKLQKWETPILYFCSGSYTQDDQDRMRSFVDWLNTVEGFPGMQETQDSLLANMHIYFCDQEEYLGIMGPNFAGTDGGITFWYNGFDEIYYAQIGYRTDIDQQTRNSVILEEIYNGLGPINDTQLRPDSIIYAEFSLPQSLTPIDELILRLLYHPQMLCGMDAAACEAVIRQLYY